MAEFYPAAKVRPIKESSSKTRDKFHQGVTIKEDSFTNSLHVPLSAFTHSSQSHALLYIPHPPNAAHAHWSYYSSCESTMATRAEHPTSRPAEAVPRPGRSPKTRASSLRHKPRSQNFVTKESEQSLHKLMEDFELGRLSAFGKLVGNTVDTYTNILVFDINTITYANSMW